MGTRERLLQATKELLRERGYEAMSPRTILARSGVGQGSLYHYFNGKANLATTALNEVAGEMQKAAYALLHTEKPALERVKDYLIFPREALCGCRLGRLSQEHQVIALRTLRTPLITYFSFLERELTQVIKQAQEERTLKQTLDAADLATSLVAIIQGGYVLARSLQDPNQMMSAVRGALALLEEGRTTESSNGKDN